MYLHFYVLNMESFPNDTCIIISLSVNTTVTFCKVANYKIKVISNQWRKILKGRHNI